MKFLLFIFHHLIKNMRLLLCVAFLVVLLCELYLRFPLLPPRLEYQVDKTLVATLRPNQRGFVWLGNMSYKSPIITVNRDGHRGEETDWSKPTVLTIGNSESFGTTVTDQQVWTSRLEMKFGQIPGLETVQVVNAAHPGHGPYDHYVRLKRIMESHDASMVIVRVDMGDRTFRRVPPSKLPNELEKAKFRLSVRKYTKGIPFLFNKIKTQMNSIKASFKPRFSFAKQAKASGSSLTAGQRMWLEHHAWWEEIARLTADNHIPLVFMIYDLSGSEGCSFIRNKLKDLTSGYKNIHILTLGPRAFGLEPGDSEQLWKKARITLSTKRDPHANPLQHELIARAVFEFLTERDLIGEIIN